MLSRVLASPKLICHPDGAQSAVEEIEAALGFGPDGSLNVTYRLTGPTDGLVLPSVAGGERTDGLWRSTCFELFIASGSGYREYNFSPDGKWAAYQFSGYRDGMAVLPGSAPMIAAEQSALQFTLQAIVPLDMLPMRAWRIGISAVVEDREGDRRFWALAHQPGPPDFHHPDCFVIEVPSADRL